MTKLLYIFLLNTVSVALLAQTTNLTDKQSKGFSNKLGAADYTFNVGSQVGTSFNNSYYLSNYFSPNASFDLTKKLSVIVGVGVAYTQLNNIPIYNNDFNKEYTNASQTSFYTYASGIYKLNQKVNLNATIMIEEAMINTSNAPIMQNRYKDVSVGINYNITSHFSINAQMQFTDRPYNSYNRSYSGFGNNSPFGFSPFY